MYSSIYRLAASFDRQLYLSTLVGPTSWHFDLPTGILSFGKQHRWHAQILGSESITFGTWLWAWANTENNIPVNLLVASLDLKAHGEQHGIPELSTPQLPLDQVDGHTLGLLASGICEANAYYRCPYEGGALFVLIMDDNFPKCPDPALQRIAAVFPQAIASLDIPDHRLALTGYLDHYGLAHERDGDRVVVKEGGELVLTATFDELNRLTKLEVRLAAETAAPGAGDSGESWDDGQLRRMLGG